MTTMNDSIEREDHDEQERRAKEVIKTFRLDQGDHFELLTENASAAAYKMTHLAIATMEQMSIDRLAHFESLTGSPEAAKRIAEEINGHICPVQVVRLNALLRFAHDIREAIKPVFAKHNTPDDWKETGPNDITPVISVIESIFSFNVASGWFMQAAVHSIERATEGDEAGRDARMAQLAAWSTTSALSIGDRAAKYYNGKARPGSKEELNHGVILDPQGLSPADEIAVAGAFIGTLKTKHEQPS